MEKQHDQQKQGKIAKMNTEKLNVGTTERKAEQDIYQFRNSLISQDDSNLDDMLAYCSNCVRQEIYAVLTLPPQYDKPTTIQQVLITYLMVNNPTLVHGYLTRESTMAERKSYEIQKMAIKKDIVLDKRDKAKSNWLTTSGGGMVAKGLQSGVSGWRVNGLLVFEDIYNHKVKDRKPKQINKIENMVVSTCVEISGGSDQGGIIIIDSRWHKNDIIGKIQRKEILKGFPFKHFHYPENKPSKHND